MHVKFPDYLRHQSFNRFSLLLQFSLCVFHHGFKVVVQTPWLLSQWALEAAGIRTERVHQVRPVGRRRLIGSERRMLPRWGTRLCVLCALESLKSNAIGGERGRPPLRGFKDGHDNDGQFDLWVCGIFYIQFDLWGKNIWDIWWLGLLYPVYYFTRHFITESKWIEKNKTIVQYKKQRYLLTWLNWF